MSQIQPPSCARLSCLGALLVAAGLASCGNPGTEKSRPVGTGEEDSGAGDGGDGADGGPIVILPDRPATYDSSGVVTVTGRVEGVENLAGLYADLEPVSVDADGAFSIDLSLDGEPWRILTLHGADTSGREAAVTVQVGLAEAGEEPVQGGLQSSLGPLGLEQVAAYLPPLLAGRDLGPEPGLHLTATDCEACPTGTECEPVPEALVTTGAWSIEPQVSLDTSGGLIDVVLDDTRILWEVELQGIYTIPRTGRLVATLSPGAGVVRGQRLDLDLALSDDHAWTVEWDGEGPTCTDMVEATATVEQLYLTGVPPELEAATLLWGSWLELALTHELDEVTLSRESAADSAGIVLRYSGSLGATLPYLAPAAPELSPDAVDHALHDRLLGALMTARLPGRLPSSRTWTDGGAGAAVSVTLHAVSDDTVALTDVASGALLLPPVAYTIAIDDTPCEVGNLIPAGVAIPADIHNQRGRLTPDTDNLEVAGSDVEDGCALGDGRFSYLRIALREALTGQAPLAWGPATGLADQGATLDWSDSSTWSIRSTPAGP